MHPGSVAQSPGAAERRDGGPGGQSVDGTEADMARDEATGRAILQDLGEGLVLRRATREDGEALAAFAGAVASLANPLQGLCKVRYCRRMVGHRSAWGNAIAAG